MSHFIKRSVIHPEDYNDLMYWTKKWGVSIRQINDAILETGSVKPEEIKNAINKKSESGKLFFWIYQFLRPQH